jgi:hypothetical protein
VQEGESLADPSLAVDDVIPHRPELTVVSQLITRLPGVGEE